MTPEEFFRPGTVSFTQMQQALGTLDTAKEMGLDVEGYYENLRSAYDIAKNTKDFRGLDAAYGSINNITPQIKTIAESKQGEAQKNLEEQRKQEQSVNSIVAATKLLIDQGVLNDKDVAAINNVLEQRDPGILQTVSEGLGEMLNKALVPEVVDNNAAIEDEKDNVEKTVAFIDTLKDLRYHPGFNGLFGLFGTTWLAGDAADAEAKLKQVGAKSFLESISQMRGLGSLSDAEGARLEAALISLNKGMSEDGAKKAIDKMLSTLYKKQGKSIAKIKASDPSYVPPRESRNPLKDNVSGDSGSFNAQEAVNYLRQASPQVPLGQ